MKHRSCIQCAYGEEADENGIHHQPYVDGCEHCGADIYDNCVRLLPDTTPRCGNCHEPVDYGPRS